MSVFTALVLSPVLAGVEESGGGAQAVAARKGGNKNTKSAKNVGDKENADANKLGGKFGFRSSKNAGDKQNAGHYGDVKKGSKHFKKVGDEKNAGEKGVRQFSLASANHSPIIKAATAFVIPRPLRALAKRATSKAGEKTTTPIASPGDGEREVPVQSRETPTPLDDATSCKTGVAGFGSQWSIVSFATLPPLDTPSDSSWSLVDTQPVVPRDDKIIAYASDRSPIQEYSSCDFIPVSTLSLLNANLDEYSYADERSSVQEYSSYDIVPASSLYPGLSANANVNNLEEFSHMDERSPVQEYSSYDIVPTSTLYPGLSANAIASLLPYAAAALDQSLH